MHQNQSTSSFLNVHLVGLFVLVSGCSFSGGEESSTSTSNTPVLSTATTDPTPTQPAQPTAPAKVGGELTVNYPFIGFTNQNVKIGSAVAYFRDNDVQIEMAADTLGAIDCGHRWNLGRDVADGQLGFEVRSRGISYNAPVKRAVGTYQHVGYTYYYRRAGFDRGTNSGNSARETNDTELEITAISDTTVSGRVRIRDQVSGTFVARICPTN